MLLILHFYAVSFRIISYLIIKSTDVRYITIIRCDISHFRLPVFAYFRDMIVTNHSVRWQGVLAKTE